MVEKEDNYHDGNEKVIEETLMYRLSVRINAIMGVPSERANDLSPEANRARENALKSLKRLYERGELTIVNEEIALDKAGLTDIRTLYIEKQEKDKKW